MAAANKYIEYVETSITVFNAPCIERKLFPVSCKSALLLGNPTFTCDACDKTPHWTENTEYTPFYINNCKVQL